MCNKAEPLYEDLLEESGRRRNRWLTYLAAQSATGFEWVTYFSFSKLYLLQHHGERWAEFGAVVLGRGLVPQQLFVSLLPIIKVNVHQIVVAGCPRWNIENENNNTLKTKGYRFEHKFCHLRLLPQLDGYARVHDPSPHAWPQPLSVPS